MNKIFLTICTLLFTFILSINVFAASDSMQIDQSYEKNNKRINRDFDHDFYDPNHVQDDRDNIFNTNNQLNDLRNDLNNNVNDRTNNVNRYYERTGTPSPVANTTLQQDEDVNLNFGWVGFLVLAGLIGLAAYFIFRRKERVE